MNHFYTSTGERVAKSVIDRKVREAKAAYLEQQRTENIDGSYNFCEDIDCNKSVGVRLSVSHEVSVNDCQRNGTAELAWSFDNMKVRCIPCHQRFDGNGVMFKGNE